MIKTLFRQLFQSEKKGNETIKEQKSNPNITTNEDAYEPATNSDGISDFKLEKGQIQSIYLPKLGDQKNLTLAKWCFNLGDIVKHGDIICVIENENISMEFETYFSGRIVSICKENQSLSTGTELCKIEGV